MIMLWHFLFCSKTGSYCTKLKFQDTVCMRLSPDVIVYRLLQLCTIAERTLGENISFPLKVSFTS